MAMSSKRFRKKEKKMGAGPKRFAFIAVTGLLLASAAPGISAQDAQSGIPAIMDLNLQKKCPSLEGLPKDKKEVKGFSHADHAGKYLAGNAEFALSSYTDEFTCKACHKEAESKDELVATPPCERLGDALAETGGPSRLKSYFHDMCLACHKSMVKAGKPTGPKKCSGCHNRK